MIRLENVTKYYTTARGRHYVFRNVSIEFPDGVNVGIVGRNGSGKSTLLRLLGGNDIPNHGRIIRTGRISGALGAAAGIQGNLSGSDNARFACRIHGVPAAEIPAKMAFIEKFADIGKFFTLPIGTYSAGMRARLKTAIAISFGFDTYLLDEMSATGDVLLQRKTDNAFASRKSQFIKTTHDLHELLTDCDAGVVINQGTLTYYSDVADAVKAYLAFTTPDDPNAFANLVAFAEKLARRRDRRAAARESGAGGRVNEIGRPAHAAAPMATRVRPKPDEQAIAARVQRRAERRKARTEGAAPEAGVSDRRKARRQRNQAPAEHSPSPMSMEHTPAPMAPRLVRPRPPRGEKSL